LIGFLSAVALSCLVVIDETVYTNNVTDVSDMYTNNSITNGTVGTIKQSQELLNFTLATSLLVLVISATMCFELLETFVHSNRKLFRTDVTSALYAFVTVFQIVVVSTFKERQDDAFWFQLVGMYIPIGVLGTLVAITWAQDEESVLTKGWVANNKTYKRSSERFCIRFIDRIASTAVLIGVGLVSIVWKYKDTENDAIITLFTGALLIPVVECLFFCCTRKHSTTKSSTVQNNWASGRAIPFFIGFLHIVSQFLILFSLIQFANNIKNNSSLVLVGCFGYALSIATRNRAKIISGPFHDNSCSMCFSGGVLGCVFALTSVVFTLLIKFYNKTDGYNFHTIDYENNNKSIINWQVLPLYMATTVLAIMLLNVAVKIIQTNQFSVMLETNERFVNMSTRASDRSTYLVQFTLDVFVVVIFIWLHKLHLCESCTYDGIFISLLPYLSVLAPIAWTFTSIPTESDYNKSHPVRTFTRTAISAGIVSFCIYAATQDIDMLWPFVLATVLACFHFISTFVWFCRCWDNNRIVTNKQDKIADIYSVLEYGGPDAIESIRQVLVLPILACCGYVAGSQNNIEAKWGMLVTSLALGLASI